MNPSPAPKVSIVLVNFNTTRLLLDCLQSIEDHFDACTYEVIVVDNASDGFVPTDITWAHPHVRVLTNAENLGFGAANNLGAEVAAGTYLWLLNTDTLIPPRNNLGAVLDFLDENPGHAAASPKLVNARWEPQAIQRAYFPSLGRLVAEKPARWLARAVPAARRWLGWIDFNFKPFEEGDVPVVVAASMFIRRQHFHEVGGFSPDYFMYLEDSDLCRKFAQHGYRVRFLPQATVVHHLGGSIRSQYDRMLMYVDSRERYFRRWSSPPVWVIVRGLRGPALLVHRRREAARVHGPSRSRRGDRAPSGGAAGT